MKGTKWIEVQIQTEIFFDPHGKKYVSGIISGIVASLKPLLARCSEYDIFPNCDEI